MNISGYVWSYEYIAWKAMGSIFLDYETTVYLSLIFYIVALLVKVKLQT